MIRKATNVEQIIALFDSCVLYSAPLRDFWMWLATTTNLFQAKWSVDIHREWMRNVLLNRPDLSGDGLNEQEC